MNSDYKADLDAARAVLKDLLAQRDDLEVEIAKQQRRIGALALLSEEIGESSTIGLGGLSDSVRSVLRAAGPHGLTPAEIKHRLNELGFDVSRYKNFRGSLHTVLRRLIDAKEVRRAIHDISEGRNASVYQWLAGGVKKS